jgi:hypothetical protein
MRSSYRFAGTLVAGLMLSTAALAVDQPATGEVAPAPPPAGAAPAKLICTKTTPVGSLMPVKRCITPEQQQRERDAAERMMREQSGRSPTSQTPN